MIRIEPDTLAPVLFTNEQFIAAASIIGKDTLLHYDMVEEKHKIDSITHSRLMLWAWPQSRREFPLRYWIEHDGSISSTEECDWITDDEWPAWVEPTTTEETPS